MVAPKKRKFWTASESELFVDLVFKEAEKGNRPDGVRYPKGTWSAIRDKINETMGTNFTEDQVFYKMVNTRKAWKAWCALVAAPEMKWDPLARTFGATDTEWRRRIEENTRAGPFRKKPIACEEKLAFIFKGIIEPKRRTVVSDGDEPSPLRRRIGESPSTDAAICTLAEAERTREAPLEHPNAPVNYSIGACIERLDEMEEVEKGDELYLFALELFLKKELREIFMHLKGSALRMAWLLKLRADGSATLAAA